MAAYFAANPEAKGVVLAQLFSGSVRQEIRRSWDAHVQALAEALSEPPLSR
ncbi:hypothetical protein [Cupriavidus sp. DF5525]|uniref:hypothetical protein n=1 Tax=Cupriavidus sp. DF5525 TaxID=3160989 RepID=UPI0032DF32B2